MHSRCLHKWLLSSTFFPGPVPTPVALARCALNSSQSFQRVRPIFWSNRPKAYITRTANWDAFPNGEREVDDTGVQCTAEDTVPKKVVANWDAHEPEGAAPRLWAGSATNTRVSFITMQTLGPSPSHGGSAVSLIACHRFTFPKHRIANHRLPLQALTCSASSIPSPSQPAVQNGCCQPVAQSPNPIPLFSCPPPSSSLLLPPPRSSSLLLPGRWGNSRSPAYATLSEHPFMRRHTSSDKRKQRARTAWGAELPGLEAVVDVFVKYCQGEVKLLPWAEMEDLHPETGPIK